MAFLEIKNLKKQFGSTQVLKDVSFSLEKGQVLAIIGSSGSGKTTLLRCLNFLEEPQEGQILVNDQVLWDGTSASQMTDAQLRENRMHFGLVFQSFNLFPQYTALQNVVLPMDLLAQNTAKEQKKHFDKARIHAENVEKAHKLLAQVDLSDRETNYPCQLSGGQQQRVAIARALGMGPDILCFDEPTSALDPELTGTVLSAIRQLKEQHTTMIVVTHEMEIARSVSDRVLFMADGIIEEEGTPEEVFGRPKSEKARAFLANSLK